jgi:hypothetical protein
MAASNRAEPAVVRLLIDTYPDALHLQNDDGMTPLDLISSDESANELVVSMLEGRASPPELTRRQKAEKYEERANAIERKLGGMRNSGGAKNKDLKLALAAVRKLADRFPHALYTAGMDPNELEIAFSDELEEGHGKVDAENILMEAVRKRTVAVPRDARGHPMATTTMVSGGPKDRVEDLLASIISLDHIKSQVCTVLVSFDSLFFFWGVI